MLDDAGVGLELDVQVTVVESNLSLGGAIIRSISQSPMLSGLRKFLVIAGTSCMTTKHDAVYAFL